MFYLFWFFCIIICFLWGVKEREEVLPLERRRGVDWRRFRRPEAEGVWCWWALFWYSWYLSFVRFCDERLKTLAFSSLFFFCLLALRYLLLKCCFDIDDFDDFDIWVAYCFTSGFFLFLNFDSQWWFLRVVCFSVFCFWVAFPLFCLVSLAYDEHVLRRFVGYLDALFWVGLDIWFGLWWFNDDKYLRMTFASVVVWLWLCCDIWFWLGWNFAWNWFVWGFWFWQA